MRSPLVILLLVLVLMGNLSAQDTEVRVFASHSILADVAARVAGEVLEVHTLMPPGADPHAFHLHARAVAELLEADLFFINGARFEEGILGQVLDAEASLPTVMVSDCVALWHEAHDEDHDEDHDDEDHDDEAHDEDHDDEAHDEDHDDEAHDEDHDDEAHDEAHDGDHEQDEHDESVGDGAIEACQKLRATLGLPAVPSDTLLIANNCDSAEHDDEHSSLDEEESEAKHAHACDPHVWLDPHNVMLWTAQINDALSELLPAHADKFAANANAYLAELRDLDASLSVQLQALPPPRLLVTQHDFLGYFAARFGFETQSVLQNFSSLSEANPAELADMLDRLLDRDIRAIFGEEPLGNRALEQLAEELRVTLVPIYGGSLGAVDGPAASYIDYMRENVRRIADALSGSGG